MHLDDLRALRARLDAATGLDRELDGAVASALGLPQAWFAQFDRDVDGEPWPGWSYVGGPEFFVGNDRWSGGGRSWVVPTYTASLDAVTALAAEIAPDLEWIVRPDRERGGFANLYDPSKRPNEGQACFPAYGATPPIACCLSVVAVAIARSEAEAGRGGRV